jgi:membrane protein YqaA with SNARE-associated domain
MEIIDVMLNAVEDPLTYSIIFFIYVILAAIILPIPVEVGLFNSNINSIWLVFLMAVGKGVGAFIVFEIGKRARLKLKKLSFSNPLTDKIVKASENFVIKYGYYGLLIIMSTPLMLDSVTLYLFSLLNPTDKEEKALVKNRFIGINILAGAIRGSVILLIAHFIGVRLV